MKISLEINDKTISKHFSDAVTAYNEPEAKQERAEVRKKVVKEMKPYLQDVFGLVCLLVLLNKED